MRWLLASRNHGKLSELTALLHPFGIALEGLDAAGLPWTAEEDRIEIHATFEENALAKAVYFAERSGHPCLADDSGLCVDALDGAPGVRSRRFAADNGWSAVVSTDEDRVNNEALIDACWNSGWAPPWAAQFRCAVAFASGERRVVAFGTTEGQIVPDAMGHGGFGFDPHFISKDLGLAFGVATQEEKSRISHRARAVAALMENLRMTTSPEVGG